MSNPLSRRSFAASGLTAIGAFVSPVRLFAAADTLAQAGSAAGIIVGSAIRSDPQAGVAETIARECTLVTPEYALKPANISPAPGRFLWSDVEKTYAFARANGLKVHGHTLFWYKQPLEWADRGSAGRSLDEVSALYGDYVATVMRHFPDTVSWDVFNEIAGESRRLRSTFPISEFGLDFIERLLRIARDAAPNAKLVINENDLECGNQTCRSKRKNALRIVRELRKRGAPIDAIGIQGHLSSHNAPSGSETLAFITKIEALGLDVFLSEMDVNDVDLAQDIGRRDQQVADIYREFLTTVLNSKAVKRVVFWGITDSENWIADGNASVRSDGAALRPALFDRDLAKKPAYYAVLDALTRAPKR